MKEKENKWMDINQRKLEHEEYIVVLKRYSSSPQYFLKIKFGKLFVGYNQTLKKNTQKQKWSLKWTSEWKILIM